MIKKFIDMLVYGLLLLIGNLTSFLTPKQRMKAGNCVGRILVFLFNKRYIIAKSNIRKAMPGTADEIVSQIALQSFRNLGITLLEILYLQNVKKEELLKLVKIPNPELVKKHISMGKCLIILSSDYGNLELMGFGYFVFLYNSIMIIVEQQTNSYITEKMYGLRTKFGNRTVGRYSAARSIITALQNGEVLALLGDQSASFNKDIFVDFFGIPSLTYEAPAALALKFDSALLFTVAQRQPDGTYILEFVEINHEGLSNTKDDIKKLTEIHVKVLENAIRQNPGDWAWMHKRWKHSPLANENG